MAANDAIFRHGNPVMVDYTPSGGNLVQGEVILVGNTAGFTCGITHGPIVNSTQGSLASGGGVYDVINLNNAANGAKVWWDNTNKKVTTVSTNNALFGFIVSQGGLGANTTAKALHKPYV
jgi:hypothetical protein